MSQFLQKSLNYFKKTPTVLLAGHPMLRSKAVAIKTSELGSTSLKNIMKNMESIMIKRDLLGFAAPQMGHSIRLIAYQIQDESSMKESNVDKKIPLTFLINPMLTVLDKRPESKWNLEYEFCESIPSYSGLVRRPDSIHIKALDVNGNLVDRKYSGLLARIIQHEVDHLNGICFIDKMEPASFRHDLYVDQYEVHRV
ncbi:peptide deformylase [Globomyces pollinis-pini]|nr:peptide deformylase [Globomyces pollinis-pini]